MTCVDCGVGVRANAKRCVMCGARHGMMAFRLRITDHPPKPERPSVAEVVAKINAKARQMRAA